MALEGLMADAPASGAAALAALAARATTLGGGLAGDADGSDVAPADGSSKSASDGEEESGAADGVGHGAPIPTARPAGSRAPARAEPPLVTDELAAIAASADSVLGPKLVTAIAKARLQRPLQRAYVKNLEVLDPNVGAPPGTWLRLRAHLGEGNAAVENFRRLGGRLLILELVADDSELDWQNGLHDPRSLLAALRELLELCAFVPSTQVQSRVGPSLSTGGGRTLPCRRWPARSVPASAARSAARICLRRQRTKRSRR